MMDAKGLPKHVELLTPNKEHKKLHFVGIYMISITKMHGPMNIKKWLRGVLTGFLSADRRQSSERFESNFANNYSSRARD